MSMTPGAVRRQILAAGQVAHRRHKGTAFNRIAAHFEISRQAVELWWRNGIIPPDRQEDFDKLVAKATKASE